MTIIGLGSAIFIFTVILIAMFAHKDMDNDTTKVRATAKDFFLHLGTMVALYASAVAVLTLLFQVIDYAFPDSLNQGYYGYGYNPFSGPVRWSIATLVVMFPLLWLLSWVLNKDFALNPAKRDLGLRRWLVYLTLFLTGLAIAIDLIVLVNTFLGGEITARFSLKVLSVLVVTGLIFGYYVYGLKKGGVMTKRATSMFLGAGAVLIVAAIIAGFMVMGSPQKQRKLTFDSQKTSDLQNIQWQVVQYWQRKETLPNALQDLKDPISNYVVPTDPQTRAEYEYRKTGDFSFELCADFNYETDERLVGRCGRGGCDMSMPSIAYPGAENDNWQHEAGRQCFARTIDPELYPPMDPYGRPLKGAAANVELDQAQIDAMVRAKASAERAVPAGGM